MRSIPATLALLFSLSLMSSGCGDDSPGSNSNNGNSATLCGNGAIDEGEQCDDGAANSDSVPDACRNDCRTAWCGDGVSDDGEACDDGNTVPGDGCASCAAEPGWDCDSGTCITDCGDGIAVGEEACDGTDLRGMTCADVPLPDGQLACNADCTLDVNGCGGISPAITAINGTGAQIAINPRPEDDATYQGTTDKESASSRINGQQRELAISGANLGGATSVTAVGQNLQGTINLDIQSGGTNTMLRVRFPQVMTVTAGGLFLLSLVTPNGTAEAQVFFLQGEAGECTNTINGDLTVSGNVSIGGSATVSDKLTVQGSFELPPCPSGYEQWDDPTLPAGTEVIVCRDPISYDEMVKVGDFWVDRYEATVFASDMCTGTPLGQVQGDFPTTFPQNGNWTQMHYACSVPGHVPSRFITWFQAQAACAAIGKHLITNAEWQMATEGTYDPGDFDGALGGACHTASGAYRETGMAGDVPGGTSACVSRWGVEDTIGNLSEWVGNWYGQGTDSQVGSQDGTVYFGDGAWNIDVAEVQGSVGGLFPATSKRGGSTGNGNLAGSFAIGLYDGPAAIGGSTGFRCARTR